MGASVAGQAVVFTLETQALALPLAQVERATRAVAITPLPHAPAIIAGIIDVHGVAMPVIDLRRRLRFPTRPVAPGDQLLLVITPKRRYAMLVDAVLDVIDYAADSFVPMEAIFADLENAPRTEQVPGMEHLQGVIMLPHGIVLIHDFEGFLSLQEELQLDAALQLSEAPQPEQGPHYG